MASKNFTNEEMSHLRSSSYVLGVYPGIVHFSAEFKKKFWEAISSGKNPREAVIELGIDPDILGAVRISGLKSTISKDLKENRGFRDLDSYNQYLEGYATPEGRIKQLEQQLAYKEQELEFLKKIVSLSQDVQG